MFCCNNGVGGTSFLPQATQRYICGYCSCKLNSHFYIANRNPHIVCGFEFLVRSVVHYFRINIICIYVIVSVGAMRFLERLYGAHETRAQQEQE